MHNKIQAQLLLDSTLDNLSKYKLQATPNNYRLWYEYAKGGNKTLNIDIDKSIDAQQPINQRLCEQWFVKHLADADQLEVFEAKTGINQLLNLLIDNLSQWDHSSSHFSDSLEQCLVKLDNDPDINEIKAIISQITASASKVRTATHGFNSTLHTLTDEISALRQDISRLGNEALTDALTKTTNRRGFDIALKESTDAAHFSGSECALLIADIDNFKRVNDDFGHQVGDKILCFVADTLHKNVRGKDILARYGGEEFAIVLPNTEFNGAMKLAEILRKAVSARQLTTGAGGRTIGRMSVSIGVSCYRKEESLEAFFKRADKCMYRAKDQGRDRVVGEQ